MSVGSESKKKKTKGGKIKRERNGKLDVRENGLQRDTHIELGGKEL
jgi:hypothetical protein